MTDKQIIDGVDIAGCEDYGYRGKAGYWCHNYDEPCTDYPNCIYKQLKRKEQECEELKEELQAQRDFTAHEQKLIYCVAYDETCKTGNDCKQEKCIFKDNIKLKQTLTEIKEIVGIGLVDGLQPEEYSGFLKILQAQILQKISEAINE